MANQFLGGEKLFPFSFFLRRKVRSIFEHLSIEFADMNVYYTFGAHSSLLAIIDQLGIHSNEHILLPSYLCTSVLESFKVRNVHFRFYSVNSDLTIDTNSIVLNSQLRAILVIDYFGKPKVDEVKRIISRVKGLNVAIIQDAVHTILPVKVDCYGDYIFNSFRKTTPLEGSFLISKTKMSIKYSTIGHTRFLFYKRIGQLLRFLHLKTGMVSVNSFLSYLNKGEHVYYDSRIYKMPRLNFFLLKRLSFERMALYYKEIHQQLLERFKDCVPKTFQTLTFTPFGFFLVVNRRDEMLTDLRHKSIFCPIHWALPQEVSKSEFPDSHRLSQCALTIPYTYPMTMEFNALVDAINLAISKQKAVNNI